MYKAKFKTAYLQREVPIDAVVVAGDPLEVGEVVVVTAGSTGDYLVQAVSANTVEAAKTAATHIVAQSDQTLEYGHVPVEYRDYKYSNEVVATIAGATPLPDFDGFFETAQALNAAMGNGTNGHTALVKVSEGVYTKYSSNGTAYSNANVTATTKKVALFAMINKDDVEVYDDEA